MTKKKVLVIEPHSDDSLIAAGGYLLKYADELDLYFCLMTASDLALHHASVSRQTRMEEYGKYVEHMGGKWLRPSVGDEQLPLDRESRLDLAPRSLLVKFCEKAILEVRPDTLMMMGPSFHHDHTIVYEAVIAATRPTFNFCPSSIYVMENPTYVHKVYPGNDLTPNLYVELSEDLLARKIRIFEEIFASQRRPKENSLSDQGMHKWAQHRGLEARCSLAEAFYQYYSRI